MQEQNQAAIAKLKRLLEISCELNSSADLDTLLHIMMNAASELTGSEASSVLLLDPRTRELYFAATSADSQPELLGMSVPLENSIAGAILKTAQPLIVPDVLLEPRHHTQVGKAIDLEIHSLLGVPMQAEGRKVGVLEAINKIEGGFTQEDVETLTTLATLAAIAIHKAGLIAQLKDVNEQLSELDRLKNDFLAIASHELRTPLVVILGYITLLKEETGREELGQVMDAAMRLRGLMEDMFNLLYIDAGKSKLTFSRFCLAQLTAEVVAERQELAEARVQSVQLDLPAHVCNVVADRDSIQLVLNNLLSNAIKFTPIGGHIRIRVSERPDEVWVSMSDNGPGIPKVHHQRVFTRFYQQEPHLTRRHGGLGLGLAIVKELLGLQNGRIWVESEEGKGATFTFALPSATIQTSPLV